MHVTYIIELYVNLLIQIRKLNYEYGGSQENVVYFEDYDSIMKNIRKKSDFQKKYDYGGFQENFEHFVDYDSIIKKIRRKNYEYF